MDASYRLGLSVVAATLVLSGAACLAIVNPRSSNLRAASDLTGHPNALGSFRFTERSGRMVTDADLAGRVWVTAFIFTRCPSSCPRISTVMRDFQHRLEGTGVRLVSLTVDPDHDTPEVLSGYARRYAADSDRWWFLTGPKSDVYNLISNGYRLGVAASSPSDQRTGAEAVSHSARLALVDRGNLVVGYFDSDDRDELDRLATTARRLDSTWLRTMPALNASLNALSGTLLIIGWTLIRWRRVRAHATFMALAVVASLLFLTDYLIYHAQVGSIAFRGVGPIRTVYFTILLSHMMLAISLVPLVATTVSRAIRHRFESHVRIARVTFPIWLYVSVTGVIVYLMLYQWPAAV